MIDAAGLLDDLLLELAACRRVEQNPYHHLPVFEHTLLAVGHMEQIVDYPEEYFPSAMILEPIRANRTALILAALGHDLGKPEVRLERKPGYAIFHYHEDASERLYRDMAARLGRDREETEQVSRLIRDHMLAATLADLEAKGKAGLRALRRFLARHEMTWPLLLALALADCLATRGPMADPALPRTVAGFSRALIEAQSALVREPEAALPVDGDDLIEAFGIGPGPEVGRLLDIAKTIARAEPGLSKEDLIGRIRTGGSIKR